MAKLVRPQSFKDTRQLPSEFIMMEIGRIAIVSASIEDLMHSLYWRFSEISISVGAVVTRDIKATKLAAEIVKVAEAAEVDPAIIEDLKDIFKDFAKLAQTRNEFVHWIWSWNTKTTEDRIDPPAYKRNAAGRYVKFKDVTMVADDLTWIEHRIAAHLMTKRELQLSLKRFGLSGAPDAPTPWLENRSAK